MDKKKIEELREQNKIIAKAIKEIIEEAGTTEEKIYWTKKLSNFEACGDVRTKGNGNSYVYNCREKFCCVCQEKEKNKRFLKLYNEAFNISREKLESGYAEAFLTLNYNYNSKEFENLSLAEQIKFFKRLLNKFKKKAEKLGSIGTITKIEFPFLYNVKKFQLHAHIWICIEEKNLFQLQEVWKKITSGSGNLHIGSDNKEENAETSLYYRCGNKKRNGNISVKRICNYLAKHYISTALQSNNENEELEKEQTETQENRTCGTFEKIKNIEVLKQLIKAIDGQLEAFQCLSMNGIYNKTNAERERKKEKSRRFSVLEFDKKKLENNDDDCNIYISGNDLLVEFKSNNNTIKAVEKKYGGRVETIKGKNVWGDAIELGNYTQVRKIGAIKKKPIAKKQSETTKKTGVIFKNFEIFGNIETIKQSVINSGEQGKAWACEVVQELLPYTDTEVSKVKELERENNELREANNLLKIENIELMKENEILKMRNDLQNKRKAKQIEEISNEKNKIIKELRMELEATKKAYSSTERKEEAEKGEQKQASELIVIKDDGNKVEVIEYKMRKGGGYCYISKDRTKAFTNSCYCKKYDNKGAFDVHEITEVMQNKGFEKFSEQFGLEKIE